MTEEIIIDGVNVAECQYYFYEDIEKAHTCRLIQVDDDLHYICKDNPNCYYKQLQRLKAENEELRENNDWYNQAHMELQDIHDSLQYVYQNKHCDNLKYKQALEEIRAYCMTDNIQKYTSDVFYFGKHSKNILKIINEVLNNVEKR